MEFPSFSSFIVYLHIQESLFPEEFFSQLPWRKLVRTELSDGFSDLSSLVMIATFLITSVFFVKASPSPRDIRIGNSIPQKSTPGSRIISRNRAIVSCQSCFNPNHLFIYFPCLLYTSDAADE